MAESEKLVSSSSSEQFRLVDLKLPTFTDENIKRQVQQTHRKRYEPVLRQPHINSISQILKPATDFVDSFLLAKKVPENEIELLTSNLLEFDSTFSEIMALGEHDCYGLLTFRMDETANKVVQTFEEINIHNESMKILLELCYLSWDEKAIVIMGWFVFKFLEFLGFLLHGPNQPLIELASSMAALKENPLSILGSSLEKFQLPLNQLNSLIKITLEVIKYICELTLLSDTEYIIEDLFSTGVHSAVLSLVACYIQITLLMQNGEVALELSHLISSLGYILNDIKHQYINCKPQMEEMEAHMQSNALFEDILKTRIEISQLMKSFTYSKDGHQSVIDGSTMSKVDLEVLKEKSILFFISDLDISTEEISRLLKIYEEIREEDYYKIVWVPFVLRWTEELRQKFENLKSKMPWYVVCYDSPVAGLWYIKGRWFSTHNPSFVLIDQRDGEQYVIYPPNERKYQVKFRLYIVTEKSFPFKRLEVNLSAVLSAPAGLPQLYSIHTVGPQQNNPSSGFAGLLSKSKNTTGKKHEGDIPVHTPKVT